MSKQYFVRCVETVECEVCGGTGRISIATDYATTDSGAITSLCVHCNAGRRQVHSWLDLSEALQDMEREMKRLPMIENSTPNTPRDWDLPNHRKLLLEQTRDKAELEWGDVGRCDWCGELRPVCWTPDPYIAEVSPEADPPPLWLCENCWTSRRDDI